jgi:hypothetical protein
VTKFQQGIVVGVISLLVVKYLIVGVERWNAALHPTRRE